MLLVDYLTWLETWFQENNMADYTSLMQLLANRNKIKPEELDYDKVGSDISGVLNPEQPVAPVAEEAPVAPQEQQVPQQAPEQELSATDQYKEYLKRGPSAQERWTKVAAAAADTWGGGNGLFSKLNNGRSTEGKRLQAAYNIEQKERDRLQKRKEFSLKLALRNKPDLSKRNAQDLIALERMSGIASGNNSRKGKLISKGRVRLKTATIMADQIAKFDTGSLTFDDPSNEQFGAAFAKLMGTASGKDIIEKFKYHSAYGAFQNILSWASGDPRTVVTAEQFKEVKLMAMDMARNEQESVNKAVARTLTGSIERLNRNPEQLKNIVEDYEIESGEVIYDAKNNRFKAVLTRDISVRDGGKSFQPDPNIVPNSGKKSAASFSGKRLTARQQEIADLKRQLNIK